MGDFTFKDAYGNEFTLDARVIARGIGPDELPWTRPATRTDIEASLAEKALCVVAKVGAEPTDEELDRLFTAAWTPVYNAADEAGRSGSEAADRAGNRALFRAGQHSRDEEIARLTARVTELEQEATELEGMLHNKALDSARIASELTDQLEATEKRAAELRAELTAEQQRRQEVERERDEANERANNHLAAWQAKADLLAARNADVQSLRAELAACRKVVEALQGVARTAKGYLRAFSSGEHEGIALKSLELALFALPRAALAPAGKDSGDARSVRPGLAGDSRSLVASEPAKCAHYQHKWLYRSDLNRSECMGCCELMPEPAESDPPPNHPGIPESSGRAAPSDASPLPWSVSEGRFIVDADEMYVAQAEIDTDAAFIVARCNAYEPATGAAESDEAALLEKHGIDVRTLVGFACGARCVCSFLSEDNKPCIHCRARRIAAELRARSGMRETSKPPQLLDTAQVGREEPRKCDRAVGCVRCGKPCALVGDIIPPDNLCPWCRGSETPGAPEVSALWRKGEPSNGSPEPAATEEHILLAKWALDIPRLWPKWGDQVAVIAEKLAQRDAARGSHESDRGATVPRGEVEALLRELVEANSAGDCARFARALGAAVEWLAKAEGGGK